MSELTLVARVTNPLSTNAWLFIKAINMSQKLRRDLIVIIIWVFFVYLLSLCLFWKPSTAGKAEILPEQPAWPLEGTGFIGLGQGAIQSGGTTVPSLYVPYGLCVVFVFFSVLFLNIAELYLAYYLATRYMMCSGPRNASDPIPGSALLKEFRYYQEVSQPGNLQSHGQELLTPALGR